MNAKEFHEGQKVNDSGVRDEKELLPCPFCGGEADLCGDSFDIDPDVTHILCSNNDCPVQPGIYGEEGEDAAVSKWNARANSHADLQRLAELGESLGKWAAAIHWSPYETNTQHWLNGLRERIEAFQAAYDALAKAEGETNESS